MFYIARPVSKVVGTVAPATCQQCGRESWVQLVKRRKWLTFLSLPLVPMGRAHYYMACGVCGAGDEIDGPELERAKELAETTDRLQDDEIGWEDYAEELQGFAASFDDATLSETEPAKPRGFQ